MQFGHVVFEIREHTERQTYKHADCITPHLCRGEVKTKRSFGGICPVRLSVRLWLAGHIIRVQNVRIKILKNR